MKKSEKSDFLRNRYAEYLLDKIIANTSDQNGKDKTCKKCDIALTKRYLRIEILEDYMR